jgi:hypothetical protein
VRNVVKYDYPVVESIRSILPVVDEFIVNVGRCDDGTLELIRSIGDPKIKIVESVWDETLRKDGLIYAQHYLHFLADYWSTNPWFYHKAVRIIRNNGEVESCGDAVGFHLKAPQQYLQSGPKEWIAPRLRSSRRWAARRNRWLNLQSYREVLPRGFRG